MYSGLDIILAFGFTEFGFHVWPRILRDCFFSTRVYIVTFLLLLGKTLSNSLG